MEAVEDDKYQLVTYLGIYPNDIETDRALYKVSIKRATLFLDQEGMSIVPKSKLGEYTASSIADRTIERSVSKTTTSEKAKNIDTAASGVISGMPSLDGKVALTRSEKAGEVITVSEKETLVLAHPRVKAVGADAWELTEPDAGELHRRYLNHEVEVARFV